MYKNKFDLRIFFSFFCLFSSSTFRHLKAGRRLEDCSACPAGYFCPHSATVNPRVCGAGSFSVRPRLYNRGTLGEPVGTGWGINHAHKSVIIPASRKFPSSSSSCFQSLFFFLFLFTSLITLIVFPSHPLP